MTKATMIVFTVTVCLGVTSVGFSQQPLVGKYLNSGKLSEGELVLEKHLEQSPNDDQARFGLGALRTMQAVEHLAQSWYRYGINKDLNQIPFFRLPVPRNKNPEKVVYQDVRNVFKNMIKHLDEADDALAQIKDKNVKLPLDLFGMNLDVDQDGKITEGEGMKAILRQYFGNNAILPGPNNREVVVAFDYSDVLWLRGYTHLLRAMLEFGLAYDHQPLWDVVGHRIFLDVEFKFKFLEEEYEQRMQNPNRRDPLFFWDQFTILDIIGGIHNLNFKLKEPDRMKRSREHLKKMISLSREMWNSIQAETDNDREWIPNPKQQSVVSSPRISPAMIGAWIEFLDEMDELLDGEKLAPFWRGTDETRGVNLKKVFLEPRDLDVVLWFHGSGAMPYVEFGECSKAATWNRFNRVFRGEFFGFAVWFN